MTNLSSFCIYTMRHSAELDAKLQTTGPHVLTEGKAWTTGHLLWEQARRSGELMSIVFSAAESDTGLIYWAITQDIQIAEEDRTTSCTYSDLKAITPARRKSSLRLRSTGRPLSEDFIRLMRSAILRPFWPEATSVNRLGTTRTCWAP
jgi:hypothetical protein